MKGPTLYERYPTFQEYWLSMPSCMRYGQSFVNYYNLRDSELFFILPDDRAERLAREKYPALFT